MVITKMRTQWKVSVYDLTVYTPYNNNINNDNNCVLHVNRVVCVVIYGVGYGNGGFSTSSAIDQYRMTEIIDNIETIDNCKHVGTYWRVGLIAYPRTNATRKGFLWAPNHFFGEIAISLLSIHCIAVNTTQQ